MHNLREVKHNVLFNSLSTAQAGMFTDSINGDVILKLKQHGLDLPVNANAINLAVARIEKSCEDLGVRKMTLLELNRFCPCEDCDYDYGVFIKSQMRTPGVFNNQEHIQGRGYGGTLARIECTAGVLNDDLALEMEDDIIAQVNADVDRGPEKGSPAIAFRAYRVTLANDTTETIDITINGTTTSIALTGAAIQDADAAGGYTGNTNIINATAAVNPFVRAIAVSATEMLIVGQANGEVFTVANGGIGTPITIDARYLGFMSKREDEKIMVEYEQKWATFVAGWMFTVSNPTATTTNAVSINENGTGAIVDESIVSTAANYALWNAALTNAFLTYNDTANVWYFAGLEDLGVTSLDIRITGVGTSRVILGVSPFGRYPSLTNDDVFRVFANAQHMGALSSEMRMEQPIADTPYCKFAITIVHDGIPGQDVSEHTRGEIRVDIYVPKNLVYVDHWTNGSWMDELEAAPNRHFQELLEAWSGLTLPV